MPEPKQRPRKPSRFNCNADGPPSALGQEHLEDVHEFLTSSPVTDGELKQMELSAGGEFMLARRPSLRGR